MYWSRLKSAIMYIPECPNVSELNFFYAFSLSNKNTVEFWFSFFFKMSLKEIPIMIDNIFINPQIFGASVVLVYLLSFLYFILIKKTLSNKRLLAVTLYTVLSLGLGFYLIANILSFVDVSVNEDTLSVWHSFLSPEEKSEMRRKLEFKFHFFWKLVSMGFCFIMWSILVYRSDMPLFTFYKTAKLGLPFFAVLMVLIYVWAGVKSSIHIFVLTELIASFCLISFFKDDLLSLKIFNFYEIFVFFFSKFLFFTMISVFEFWAESSLWAVLHQYYLFLFAGLFWYYSWSECVKRLMFKKNPSLACFSNSFLRVWLSFNFFLLVNTTPISLYWLFLACVASYYLFQHTSALNSIPDFAWKRIHKIAMFEGAPDAVEPEQLIKSTPFNANVFNVIFNVSNIFFNTFPILFCVLKKEDLNIVTALLVTYSITFWFNFYASVKIVSAIKTGSLLDWRGLYLVIHQYHWAVKYSIMLFIAFSLDFTYCFWITLTYLTDSMAWYTLLAVFFLMLISVVYFSNYRHYFLWSRIFTFYQYFDYEHWDNSFWKNLSPFMRDFIYWRPLPPEDEEEKDPFFFGLNHKAATKAFLLFFLFFTFMCICVTPNAIYNLNIVLLIWSFKWGIIYFAFIRIFLRVNVTIYEQNIQAMQDYAYYEGGTHFLMILILAFAVYFLGTYIPFGMIMCMLYVRK